MTPIISSLLHVTLIAIGYFIDWAVYGEPDGDSLIDDYDDDKNDWSFTCKESIFFEYLEK